MYARDRMAEMKSSMEIVIDSNNIYIYIYPYGCV